MSGISNTEIPAAQSISLVARIVAGATAAMLRHCSWPTANGAGGEPPLDRDSMSVLLEHSRDLRRMWLQPKFGQEARCGFIAVEHQHIDDREVGNRRASALRI